MNFQNYFLPVCVLYKKYKKYETYKQMQKIEFRKYVIFEGFKRNGLQIRIQREKLRISVPDEFLKK